MKKEQKLFNKTVLTLSQLLLLSAPLIVTQGGSGFFWGEPECPDCLKNIK